MHDIQSHSGRQQLVHKGKANHFASSVRPLLHVWHRTSFETAPLLLFFCPKLSIPERYSLQALHMCGCASQLCFRHLRDRPIRGLRPVACNCHNQIHVHHVAAAPNARQATRCQLLNCRGLGDLSAFEQCKTRRSLCPRASQEKQNVAVAQTRDSSIRQT